MEDKLVRSRTWSGNMLKTVSYRRKKEYGMRMARAPQSTVQSIDEIRYYRGRIVRKRAGCVL